MPHTSMVGPEMAHCIDDCQHCATTCNASVAHCLEKGGKHADPRHIALLLDCAVICETAAASMSRSSRVHREICGACADICRQCEAECRGFRDDAMMQDCADVCRKCAGSCAEMAA